MHPLLFKGPAVLFAIGCNPHTLCSYLLRWYLWFCCKYCCTIDRFFIYFTYHSVQYCSKAYHTNLKGYVRKLITSWHRKTSTSWKYPHVYLLSKNKLWEKWCILKKKILACVCLISWTFELQDNHNSKTATVAKVTTRKVRIGLTILLLHAFKI